MCVCVYVSHVCVLNRLLLYSWAGCWFQSGSGSLWEVCPLSVHSPTERKTVWCWSCIYYCFALLLWAWMIQSLFFFQKRTMDRLNFLTIRGHWLDCKCLFLLGCRWVVKMSLCSTCHSNHCSIVTILEPYMNCFLTADVKMCLFHVFLGAFRTMMLVV